MRKWGNHDLTIDRLPDHYGVDNSTVPANKAALGYFIGMETEPHLFI